MANDILTTVNTRAPKRTPQSRRSQPEQVRNNAGGYVFQVGDEARLHRFLTLGTDSNSYYQSARALTKENAEVVIRMASTAPDALIDEILAVSEAGRAPKNKQAIFALAIAASIGTPESKARALANMHRVCRTFTHLAQFNTYAEQFRGRGPALNRAIGNWYRLKPVDKLAYQAAKYRNREDWTHRDMLRLVKGYAGKTGEISPERDALLAWVARGKEPRVTGDGDFGDLSIITAYERLKEATTVQKWLDWIGWAAEHGASVSWEMLPDAALKSAAVWEALLAQGVPTGTLIRQLPRLTGVFGGKGAWVATVANQITSAENLTKARVHPINVLVAQRTYASGHSVRGSSTWKPIGDLVGALDAAFYGSYGAVEPTGKRILLAMDISGSMGVHLTDIDDRTGRHYQMPITAREVTAALALVLRSTEAAGMTDVVGFSSGGYGGYGLSSRRFAPVRAEGGLIELDAMVAPRRRLDDVLSDTSHLPHGGTDCALPFLWAHRHNRDFDAVIILTDNESWAGSVHVHQAADAYRNKVGHDVKLIAAAMTATDYSVVDPKDPSGLNISGFDSAIPQLIGDFVSGKL